MSGSGVGDSNHEYVRRNGVTEKERERERRIRGKRRRLASNILTHLREVTLREAAGIIRLIMEINCEHALFPFSKFESNRAIRKSQRKRRRWWSGGDGAVVIKEFSLEKRSPETRSAVGMRSNEWLLPGVLNDW